MTSWAGMHQVPESGKIYAFNEGNYEGWEPGMRQYIDSLKDAKKWGGKPYSARRVPHFLGHCRTWVFGRVETCASASFHKAAHTWPIGGLLTVQRSQDDRKTWCTHYMQS